MSKSLSGLAESEARRRLAVEGANALPREGARTALTVARDVVREPMLLMLLAAGLLYLLLGVWREGAILFLFALLSIVIAIVQETRTERVLDSLRQLSAPRARVIRDGAQKTIAGVDVVRGDLVLLGEGERAAADARLLQADDLLVDESLLTGESLPVRKRAAAPGDVEAPAPGGDDLPFVFAGSLVVRGSGLAEATATGLRSAIGRIGRSLGEVEREPPRLQAQTARMVRLFAVAGALVSAATVALYGATRGDWFEALLAGIAIGMSMLPEELPVVLAVFMAMGAWRISKARVLTRRAAAIESLGSATILCADKTGTLTENRMALARLARAEGASVALAGETPPEWRDLVVAACLACAQNPVDPMEKAFHAAAAGLVPENCELRHVFGLRPDLLAITQVWRMPEVEGLFAAAKGAPEAIADLCGLDAAARARVAVQAQEMARDGLRVLGLASGVWRGESAPARPHDIGLTFLGLAGLADPIRADAPAAIRALRGAGVRVVMITGDYPATAAAIAAQAGLDGARVIGGADVAAMSDEALRRAAREADVFARIMPEQKLRIVEALKANGEIVAMTGDGVNDAPSLKAAHIGIAMGGRGTDVAREAASLVLLDDDFSAIPRALALGRRIYDNLRKASAFIFAVHIPIAGLALLPLAAGLPPLLGPVHIALLEMIVDPVCTLVFEAEEAEGDVMRRPPRAPDAQIFSRDLWIWGSIQGGAALALVAGMFVLGAWRGMPEGELRALCYLTLVAAIVALIFVNRSFAASLRAAFAHESAPLVAVLVFVPSAMAVTLLWPPAAALMRFGPLHADDVALALAAAALVLLALEAVKRRLRGPARALRDETGRASRA